MDFKDSSPVGALCAKAAGAARHPLRRLVRGFPPMGRSLATAGSPVLGLDLTHLPRGERIEEPFTSRPKNPSLFFSNIGHTPPPPGTDFLPLLSAEALELYEQATGTSRSRKGLVRVAHGWYSTRRLTDPETLRALMRIVPSDTVVAGETAGLLWGVEVRPTSAFKTPFNLCVARPEGTRALRRPGVRCRVVRFEEGDRVKLAGVRCTSPLRTALDMAASSTIELATHIFEVFLNRRLVTFAQLQARIERLKGTRGVTILRAALSMAEPLSESVFETAVRLRLVEAGLPTPTPQVRVAVPGTGKRFRLDLGWEKLGEDLVRVGVECDSDAWHPLEGEKAKADQARARQIQGQGWKVLSVRFHQLRGLQLSFEIAVAQLLRWRLKASERRKWSLSKWNLRRNAWVRSEEIQLELLERNRLRVANMPLVALA